MEELKQKITNVTDQTILLKEEFEKYISDKSFILYDRWQMFVDAPDFLKNEYGWIPDFPEINEIEWFDDFSYEKHQTVDSVQFVTQIEEFNLENKYLIDHYPRTIENFKYLKSNIEKIKECILEWNYGSWIIYW